MITLLSKGWSLARSSEVILNDRIDLCTVYASVVCRGTWPERAKIPTKPLGTEHK